MCATSCRTAQFLLLEADLQVVGSARGAVSVSLPVRFPAPPSEPDVRLVDASGSPQAPSRGRCVFYATLGQGERILVPRWR
jgi:hypothetical protein